MMASSPPPTLDVEAKLRQLEERVTKVQRAVCYLVWRSGGFADP